MTDDAKLAVFFDFENLALGVRDTQPPKQIFQVGPILQRLVEKGKIVVKRAYADWEGYAQYRRTLHESGVELIYLPKRGYSGKNSADIRMVVDALDLCYSKQHIDAFALISGDSDFSPLVSKLKENNKRVIGCGVKSSTSDLLIANCDEFIYYDDLVRAATQSRRPPKRVAKPSKGKQEDGKQEEEKQQDDDKKQEAANQLLEVLASMEQDYDPVWGSALKQVVRRVHPGFNEAYYGYSSFSKLLKDVQAQGLIELEYDASRGNYQVRRKQD